MNTLFNESVCNHRFITSDMQGMVWGELELPELHLLHVHNITVECIEHVLKARYGGNK